MDWLWSSNQPSADSQNRQVALTVPSKAIVAGFDVQAAGLADAVRNDLVEYCGIENR